MTRPTNMTAAEYRALPKKRRHKYGAKKTTVDGIKFHSKGEALRFLVLRQDQRDGRIANLRCQVPMTLHAYNPRSRCEHTIGKYILDFAYDQTHHDFGGVTPRFEEYKGKRIAFGEWKRKHAEAEYGIKILLTGPAAKPKRKRARVARAA